MNCYTVLVRFIVIAIAGCIGVAQSLHPLDNEYLALSFRGLWMQLSHTPNFSSLPGTVDCGTYIRGRGNSIGVAATLEYRYMPAFHVGISAAYVGRGGWLQTPNDAEPAFDSTTGQVVDVITENSLDIRLDYVEITPTLWWTPFAIGRSTFRIDAGLRLGIPTQATLQQTRRILEPANAVFLSNQQRTINWTNGYRPLTGLVKPAVGMSVGIEHLLAISSRVQLLQRIGFDYTFTPPVRGVSWTVTGLRVELGLRYSIEHMGHEAPPPLPPPLPLDTAQTPIVEPKPLPTPTIDIRIRRFRGYREEGNELVATTPIVNAIFFDQNSAEIPPRYIRRSADSIPTDDPVIAHRNILLVIAGILHHNRESSVVLEGATAGAYEPGDTLLARRRAEAVARALEELGISPSRIRARWSRLPAIPSNMDYAEGRVENQRVDITLKGAQILEYVSKQTFADIVGELEVHVGGVGISGADISLSGAGGMAQIVHDTGTYRIPVRMRLDPGDSRVRLSAEARLPGTSIHSQDILTLMPDTLERRRVELSTKRFEAILRFEYNSSQLSVENRELLQQLVALIPNNATVEIGGSADVLGDAARNKRLADERAKATEEFLRSLSGTKQLRIAARGIERRFNDTTPEGRYLNRSIRVTIQQ